jgi:hypothetical protein
MSELDKRPPVGTSQLVGSPSPPDNLELWDTTDLLQAVEQFEGTATLSSYEFERYFLTEIELESRMMGVATVQAQNFEFTSACEIVEQVVELNRTLGTAAKRELDRISASDPKFAEELTDASQLVDGMVLLLQGLVLEYMSQESTLVGNLGRTIDLLGESRGYYVELANSSLPQAVHGQIQANLAETNIDFFNAVIAIRSGRYETAREGFRQAREKYGLLLEGLRDLAKEGDKASNLIDQIIGDVGDRHTYTHALFSFANFFQHMQAGEPAVAVEDAADAVALGEKWLQKVIGNSFPIAIQNLRRLELEMYRGWLAWSCAEYAIDERRWDDLRRYVREARQYWGQSRDLAMRHALRSGLSPQYDLGNTELLLQTTLRRGRREEELCALVDSLREERRQIGPMVINAHGGSVATGETSKFEFKGDVTAGAIGPNAKNRAEAISSEHTEINAQELRSLAEQLAQLSEAIAAGARTDTEKNALYHVRRAEDLARRGDEHGVRENLRAAGRWVLSIAEKLTLTVAEAAIKSSIGA